jgi:hypothetical protein
MKISSLLLALAAASVLSGCPTARRSEPVAGPFRPTDAALKRGEAL